MNVFDTILMVMTVILGIFAIWVFWPDNEIDEHDKYYLNSPNYKYPQFIPMTLKVENKQSNKMSNELVQKGTEPYVVGEILILGNGMCSSGLTARITAVTPVQISYIRCHPYTGMDMPGASVQNCACTSSFKNSYKLSGSVNKPNQTIMNKISNAFKKFLNSDLQAQVKAGFRNGELELTPAGQAAVIELVASGKQGDDYAQKLTDLANEVVGEQEKNK